MSDFEAVKMSPHSQDAEEAVLGSIIIDPLMLVLVMVFLKPEDFFILRNKYVYEAILAIHDRRDVVEYLTIIDELKAQGRLHDVGGAAYITYLASNVGNSQHAESYARIVERSALRRRMLGSATEIEQLARDETIDAVTAYERGRRTLDGILPTRFKTAGMQHVQEAYSDYFDQITFMFENAGAKLGIPTGFTDLDNLTGGWQDTDLIILAGRPGMGKTSLQVNMAVNASESGKKGFFASLEMSTKQLMDRIIAIKTGINSQRLRFGNLSEAEYSMVLEAGQSIQNWGLTIDDTPAMNTNQLRAKCMHLKALGMLDFVYVDYLQKMGANNRGQDRNEQVRQMAEDLKNLAKELRVPVIAAAQLSRAVEQRPDKRPLMSDLAESGNIEREADVICFLYRDDYYNEASDRPNEADLMVVKHRNGPTGNVVLFFRKELTQFANLTKTKINLGDAF